MILHTARLSAALAALSAWPASGQQAPAPAVPPAVNAAGAAAAAVAGPGGGEVMFIAGQAERIAADGSAVPLAKGMPVREGDKVRTRADSHVYVRLRDGGLLVVRPSSELRMDVWRFNPAQPQDSQIRYTLDSGGARHVSGQAAKAARDKFRFNTPMAAIGVRGTDFTVQAQPDATRVSVRTGGVIVSSLGQGCRADGLGPCNDGTAVELFASVKPTLVQLRPGDRRPEVIAEEGTAVAEKGKSLAQGGSDTVALLPKSGSEVDLAEARTPGLERPPVAVVVPLPEPMPTPVPTTPVAVVPDGPLTIAAWGRWAPLAAQPAGLASPQVSAEDILRGRDVVAINALYLLAANRMDTPTVLPGNGTASFRLFGHEGVLTDKTTGTHIPTEASDGVFRVDFGTRRFETSLNVKNGELGAEIAAKGSIEANGRFQSDPFVNRSVINGLLGGGTALKEAVYLYQRNINDRYDAAGVASWRR